MEHLKEQNIYLGKFFQSLDILDIRTAQIIFEKYSDDWKGEFRIILSTLAKYLTSEYEEYEEFFEGCSELLDKLADNEDVLYIVSLFAEEIQRTISDTTFISLLFPALKASERLRMSDNRTLRELFRAIYNYIQHIDVKEINGEVPDEVNLRVDLIYGYVVRGYELIIASHDNRSERNISMATFLIHLLGKPLGYLDLTLGERKSRIRILTERIVMKISLICPDPFSQLYNCQFLDTSSIAYGNFLYLKICENIACEIPKIYNFSYIFYSSLKSIINLLRTESKLVIEKGLCLSETILSRCLILPHYALEIESNKDFVQALENIIVFHEFENCRKHAFVVYQLYVKIFEVQGKYKLLCHLVREVKHAGLVGYTIILYKEILVDLQKKNDSDLSCFNGEQLYNFINNCCDISHDLMKGSDSIVSLLNLMRFSILQEKFHSFPGIRNIVKVWQSKFLQSLQTDINQFRRDLKENGPNIEQEAAKNMLNVSVGGEDLTDSCMDFKKRLEVCVTGIDMIESLLNRVNEILMEKDLYY